MNIPSRIPGFTTKDIEEEAARVQVDILAGELGKAHGKISLLEDRLASTRSVLAATTARLHEEIANAEQAEERLASVEAHSANVIEANGELMERVMALEGFLVLCGRHFTALNRPHWTEEAHRVVRGEKA